VPNEIQPQLVPPTLTPTSETPLSAPDELALLDSLTDANPGSLDLVISPAEPEPIGRSWKYDFTLRQYVRGHGQLGPSPTRDAEALVDWVEKCLLTARGAHPVHPPGYGLVHGSADLIGGLVGAPSSDLEVRVADAVTFHPRISGIANWTFDYDPMAEWQAYSFTLVLDDDTTVQLDRLRLMVR
jgi:hypothetical protein